MITPSWRHGADPHHGSLDGLRPRSALSHGKKGALRDTKESRGISMKEAEMPADGIEYVRRASPLHRAPTPEIEAALAAQEPASPAAKPALTASSQPRDAA